MSSNEEKRWVNHYTGPETPMNIICEQFSKYEGGNIELSKDDASGIATIKINHPERRNALSGIQNVKRIFLHYYTSCRDSLLNFIYRQHDG